MFPLANIFFSFAFVIEDCICLKSNIEYICMIPMQFRLGDQSPRLAKDDIAQSNERIIKLIRAKICPLQKSRTYKHLFPKLQLPKLERHCSSFYKNGQRYIEVEITEEEENLLIVPQTDLEQELRFNLKRKTAGYRLNSKKKTASPSQPFFNLTNLSEPKQDPAPTVNYCDSSPFNEELRSGEQTLREDLLLKQGQQNIRYLNKVKADISDNKKRFMDTCKVSWLMDSAAEKGNCSLEYLVNRLETNAREATQKRTPVSAYEHISPNKLPAYLRLFQHSNQQWLNVSEDRGKSSYNESKQVKLIRQNGRKKTTMVEEQDNTANEKVSAKLRMKGNHRRMIELIKK